MAAHRVILQGASPYFKAMMVPERSEYKKGRATMECTGEMGRELVKFLYTSELDTDILEENVIAFLRVADMYLLDGLKEMTERLMVDLLNKHNMVEFFVGGSMYIVQRGEDLRDRQEVCPLEPALAEAAGRLEGQARQGHRAHRGAGGGNT